MGIASDRIDHRAHCTILFPELYIKSYYFPSSWCVNYVAYPSQPDRACKFANKQNYRSNIDLGNNRLVLGLFRPLSLAPTLPIIQYLWLTNVVWACTTVSCYFLHCACACSGVICTNIISFASAHFSIICLIIIYLFAKLNFYVAFCWVHLIHEVYVKITVTIFLCVSDTL